MGDRVGEQLVRSLLKGEGVFHACDNPQLIETHISWLVLLGDYAYKLKKPVNLGFIDCSTLALRKHYCEEELRLNRRTAPDIYLDVQPISGTEAAPRLGDNRQPFEYAVRMRRFDNDQLLDRLAQSNQVDEPVVLALADAIANFHAGAARLRPDQGFATPKAVRQPVEDNFHILETMLSESPNRKLMDRLHAWSDKEFRHREINFDERRETGFVRECHGDLHLGNILYSDRQCILFDCIDFNDALRWIDTASDIAFTIMDLEARVGSQPAWLLLNEYLQLTGDYGALAVMDYYKVYRALVRAKVAAIRADQDSTQANALQQDINDHLELAAEFTQSRQPFMLLMSGASGTGKTWLARKLAPSLEAIHIRSDVERKRLFKLDIISDSHAHGVDIYTDAANQRTFNTLSQLAEGIIAEQFPVIIDATFIEHSLRQKFIELAQRLEVPWAIVSSEAPAAIVKTRLASREGDASEAGFQQYLDQLARMDAFDESESQHLVRVDTAARISIPDLSARVRRQWN